MLAISIHRVKNGHFIDLPNHFYQDYYPVLMNLPDFEDKLAYFSQQFGLEMTPDIVAQIFISFLQNDIFLDPQQFFDSLNKNEESRYSYQLLSQILERLSKAFNIKFANQIADNIIFMSDGEIIEQGKMLIRSPKEEKTKIFLHNYYE